MVRRQCHRPTEFFRLLDIVMTSDLASFSHPVSDFLGPPMTPDDWERYHLSDQQVAQFHQQGYLAGIRILDNPQIETLRAELATLVDPRHPGHDLFHEFHSNESIDPSRVLFHALGAWRIAPGFHDLLWHPALLVPAYQLLGGPVRFWHDQLFCKPAQHGGVVAWHQDYSYWTRTVPMAHLTCWMGLDDARADNGCLQYVRGSHRWPLLPITGLAGDMDSIREVLTPEQLAAFQPRAIELSAGEAAFHHPLLVHGSFANDTDRPRRATVVNLLRADVTSASSEPLLAGVPAVPVGQTLSGRFFPLLYDGHR